MLYLLPFLFICSQLFCNDPFLTDAPPEKSFSPTSAEYLIGGLVNPANGQFSLSATDLVAVGAEPLTLSRYYYPPEVKQKYSDRKKEDHYLLGKALTTRFGWIFFPHIVATFQYIDTHNRGIFTLTEPDGSMLQFKKHRDGHFTLESKGPFTNSNGEIVSAAFDSRNTTCSFDGTTIVVHSKDGTKRYYERGKLQDNSYQYYLKKEKLPNGRLIIYTYTDNFFLSSIESKDPSGRLTYATLRRKDNGSWITHTGQTASYDFQTISHDGSYFFPIGYNEYDYEFYLLSKVDSALSHELYGYSSRGILCWQSNTNPVFSSTYSPFNEILRLSDLQLPVGKENAIVPTHKITYKSHKNDDNEITNSSTIVKHPDETTTQYRFWTKSFSNTIIHEGKEINSIWNKKGYLSQIEVKGLYRKEFIADDYGNAKLETFIDLLSGEGYQIHRKYQKNLLLEEETDSGLTTTYTYLPETNLITSKIIDGSDGLHLEEHYAYDEYNNLIETQINDRVTKYLLRENHPHLHMIDWIIKEDSKAQLHYDEHANVIQEDHYDANGEFVYSIHKEYNERGQVTSETNPIGQKFTYTYNIDGRLTSSSKPKQTMEYDRRGRLISSSDALYTTTYKYDASDNLVEKHNRFGSICCNYKDKKLVKALHGDKVTTSSYDIYGREISKTDSNGNTTYYKYNSRNQPTAITHPDGSKEFYRYYLNGTLKSHTDQDGNTISYEYDSFERVLKQIYEGIGEENFVYDALHLLSHTDLEGYTTYYFYDELGRKIKEERCGRITEYSYDSLGRVATTTKGGITTEFKYDLLDRVIEESTPHSKVTYTYDEDGNKSSITSGDSTETFVYDPLKRLIKQADPLGKTTTIEYTDFQKITTDAKGVSITETYDIHENLISKEIPHVTAFRYSYDPEGKLIKEEEDVYKNREYLKTLITIYTYTSKNEIESINKYGETTSYTYTPSGKVKTKTKPDETVIEYEYDKLGNLIRAGTDTFIYNKLSHLISGTGFTREVDPFDNILKETLSTGLSIQKTYDDLDRPLTVTLPTGTINYSYDLRLKTISYKDYTHTYSYNPAGHILRNGFTIYTRDAKGQITKIKAPHISQECTYDPLGNLTFATPNSYDYDELSQLDGEFDSHFDPPGVPETGNITEHNGFKLTYDDQDRLIKANSIEFTYDALGRRLSKNNETYLYDSLTEIGTFKDGHFYLKINNVLLDLDGTLAIPLFDATHTLCYLIDPNTHEILNSYEFDPFGNTINTSEPLYNPYRYAFKHYDEETGLIYFGKRYYDPSTKRWITPDPAGPIDLINLYTFVRNNPFRYADYTGLFSSPFLPRPNYYDPMLEAAFSHAEYPYRRSIELTQMKAAHTKSFSVGYYNRLDKAIFNVNGINTPIERMEDCTWKTCQYAGYLKTTGIYNPTNGLRSDLIEYSPRAGSIHLVTSQVSKELYYNLVKFHLTAPPSAKALIHGHSGGTTEIRNMLDWSQPAIRNRALVLAIAPSAIVSSMLCYKSFNYASENDLVPKLAAIMTPDLKNQLIHLKPHASASKWNDHEWDSPTYQPVIQGHFANYIRSP